MLSGLKNCAASAILRWMLPWFDTSVHSLDRLLAKAIRLQHGVIADEDFRLALEEFYRTTTIETLATQIGFVELRTALSRPGSYKAGILRLAGARPGKESSPRFSFWPQRFKLLQRLHVRCDVLVLRMGEQIPPHGHQRVVSGFYLLDGEVACRHYDRVREDKTCLLIRCALDATHQPGGYSTNSEYHHNIHWLQGIARVSYLFRVTVTQTPTQAFGRNIGPDERIYVDPTAQADNEGLIRGRYVSEEIAKKLRLLPIETFVASPS